MIIVAGIARDCLVVYDWIPLRNGSPATATKVSCARVDPDDWGTDRDATTLQPITHAVTLLPPPKVPPETGERVNRIHTWVDGRVVVCSSQSPVYHCRLSCYSRRCRRGGDGGGGESLNTKRENKPILQNDDKL